MTKCSNWKNVIPNLSPRDVVTTFEGSFKLHKANGYNNFNGEEIKDPLETYACVKRAKTGKVGVYNSEGKVIVPEEYDYCDVFITSSPDSYVSAIFVKKNFVVRGTNTFDVCGLFDAEGKIIVPVEYQDIRLYPNDRIIVQGTNYLYGMYTHKGEKIVDCIFGSDLDPNDEIFRFAETLKKRKFEDIHMFGPSADYTDILETYTGIRKAASGKMGVYNAEGQQIVPEWYDYCEPLISNTPEFFISGILVRKYDTSDEYGRAGLYNAYGRWIIPPKPEYRYIYAVDDMFIVSDKNEQYGMYSPEGQQITECIYDRIEYKGSLDEGRGRAIVVKKGLYGVISEKGEEIVPIEYGYVEEKDGGYKVINPQNHELYGWYSKDGKIKIPCKYSKIKIKNNEIRVETPDGKRGVYSMKGTEILSAEYGKIKQIGSYKVTYDKETDTLKVFSSEGNILFSTK